MKIVIFGLAKSGTTALFYKLLADGARCRILTSRAATISDRYYAEADWELSPSPLIPEEQGSIYVKRIVDDRRASMKLPLFVSRR